MKNKKIGYYVADIDTENNSSLGVQRFSLRLLQEFYKKDINLTLFCNEKNYYLFKKYEKKFKIIKIKNIFKNRILNRLAFDQFLIKKYAKKENIDILIFPKGFIPFFKSRKIKYFPVIHDLIPKYYVKDKKINFKTRLKFVLATILLIRASKKADKIFTISNFSRKDLAKHTKKEIIVIPEGFDIEKPLTKLSSKLKILNKKPFFYIIGNKHPHKNIKKTIELFLEFNKKNKNKYNAILTCDKIKRFEKENPVIFLERVNDKELSTIYNKAKLSMFMSSIEGFGLPFIESYSFETPVIYNNKTSLKELGKTIGSKGACEINNKDSVFIAISDILKMNKKEIEKNKKILEKKYNWNNCVNEIIKNLN